MDEIFSDKSSKFSGDASLTECKKEKTTYKIKSDEEHDSASGKGDYSVDVEDPQYKPEDDIENEIEPLNNNSSASNSNSESKENNDNKIKVDNNEACQDNLDEGSVGMQSSSVWPTRPIRRRHSVRQQRRQEAKQRIALPASILAQWQRIGAEWGLHSNNEIAHFLMQRYEDSVAGRPLRPSPPRRCAGCGGPLILLPCDSCGSHQHSNRVARDHRDQDGEMFCGRCRD